MLVAYHCPQIASPSPTRNHKNHEKLFIVLMVSKITYIIFFLITLKERYTICLFIHLTFFSYRLCLFAYSLSVFILNTVTYGNSTNNHEHITRIDMFTQ